MRGTLQTSGLRGALADAYLDTVPLVMLNVLWFLALIPLVTALPATAGLFYATNRLAHGKAATWRDFVDGMRRYVWHSYRWGALNVLIAAILIANALYYGPGTAITQVVARGIVALLTVLWLAINVYWFPLLFEQEKPSLRLALRNSLVIMLKRPLFSFGVTIGLTAILALSTFVIWPAWIVITGSFFTYNANRATFDSVRRMTPPRKEQQ